MAEAGFSGTQAGMTEHQLVAVDSLVLVYKRDFGINTWHLGDCIGADAQMWEIVKRHGCHTEGHPPVRPDKRAFLKYDVMWPPYEYLERNGHIVRCSARMIFTPEQDTEQLRSGTWATVRRARKAFIPYEIVFPDGRIATYEPVTL